MSGARKKDNVKKTLDADENRRRRGETTLQLRKNKKEEGLAKRRNMALGFLSSEGSAETVNSTAPASATVSASNKTYTVHDIPQLMVNIQSPDISQKILALKAFRRLLSTEKNPPVQECVDCGVLPIFVAFLQVSIHTEELYFYMLILCLRSCLT